MISIILAVFSTLIDSIKAIANFVSSIDMLTDTFKVAIYRAGNIKRSALAQALF